MHFVNAPGSIKGIVFSPFSHPGSVGPFVLHFPGNGRCLWLQFPIAGKGVAFFSDAPLETCYPVFVKLPLANTRDKSFPDTAVIPSWLEQVRFVVPIVEI